MEQLSKVVFTCREKEEEKGTGEDDEEDLIAKAENDFFASINADLKDLETKFAEKNRIFEDAKKELGLNEKQEEEKPTSEEEEQDK